MITSFRKCLIKHDDDYELDKVVAMLQETDHAPTVAKVEVDGWSIAITLCQQATTYFDRADMEFLYLHLGGLLRKHFGAFDWQIDMTIEGKTFRRTNV